MGYLAMFVASVVLGLLFALRTKAIVLDKKYLASVWTFWSIFASSLMTVFVIQDAYQILPMALGQALGTWIVMKYQFFK